MAPWAGKGARITPGFSKRFEVGIHDNDDACCRYLYVEAKSRALPLRDLEQECTKILACIINDILTYKLVMDTPAAELRVEQYSLEEARKKDSLLTHMEPVTVEGNLSAHKLAVTDIRASRLQPQLLLKSCSSVQS